MRLLMWIAFAGLLLLTGAAGYAIGAWHQKANQDPGTSKRFAVDKQVAILSSSGKPAGRLPEGTILYQVPDPYGERTTLFKAYFEVYDYKPIPIHQVERSPAHPRELEKYGLESLARGEANPASTQVSSAKNPSAGWMGSPGGGNDGSAGGG